MKKTIGIDLGTNSIGWAIREENERLENQIIDKGVLLFDKGVASEKGNEFPKVQKRTESRGKRRNYQAEKYRKFELLEFLIQNKMSPLTIEELDKWRKYKKGRKRKYPQSEKFINWLRFDFDGNGKPDFHLFDKNKRESYYVFRAFAINEKYKGVYTDNRHILGRVFYQLVQRRGFKGRDEKEAKTMLEGSKKTGTAGRNDIKDYIDKYKTLGAALYYFQKDKGGRIRQRYNLRKDYEFELKEICKVHNISESDYKKLWKAIIWQRPLRTQKGLIGLCTYEKNKRRVAVSHPLYQEYKTWILINNLKIVAPNEVNQETYLKENIYPLFIRKSDFEITHIVNQITKDGAKMESKYAQDKLKKTKVVALSNFYDFKQLLGEDWKEKYQFDNIHNREVKQNKKQGIFYTIEDLWHVLQTFDSKEKIKEFALLKLGLDEEKAKKFSEIKLSIGFATLSLSAVKRILPYLKKGIKYSTAVYLANLPKVLGTNEITKDLIEYFIEEIETINKKVSNFKTLNFIVNSLIKNHLEENNRYFIEDNRELDESEKRLIFQKLELEFGEKTWNNLLSDDKQNNFEYVAEHFRNFLKKKITDKKNIYLKQPRFHQEIFNILQEKYDLPDENIKYLWHPSEQEKYPNALIHHKFTLNGKTIFIEDSKMSRFVSRNPEAENELISLKLLGSPEPISKGFKNPMALKTLHKLKQLLNYLLQTNQIDEDTRIVIEIARELNDNNMRTAIRTYQNNREKESEGYTKQIEEINKECNTDFDVTDKTLLKKIRLWNEQNRRCIYTGETINMCDVLNGNIYDIEHTIPASMSFDSELKNLTIADTDFNRNIKKKQIPTQLPNFYKDAIINGKTYSAIEPRLSFMKDKVEKLERDLRDNLRYTKTLSDKGKKDIAIQKRHLIKFDLKYWKKKYNTFTIEEYKPQWRNSQLRDTQIMTKYALPYLKTVFKRVTVQKGIVVDDFKRIYKVLLDEKKDRSKHSHHAIDAAILTLIPSSYHREKILEKYNMAQELKQKYHTSPIGWKDFKASYIIDIEKEVLANNLVDDRTLTPTYKKVRKRGKVQYVSFTDKNGKKQYKTDEKGNKIPLISKGDTIRGQLHSESFYGAIKQPKRDENNKILFDNNRQMILKDEIQMVIRRTLKFKGPNDIEGFKSLAEIDKVIVDKALFEQIKLQIGDKPFKDAMQKGIWMLDKNGNKVNRIRRVRCYVLSGRGTLKFKTALPIHKHTFVSKKAYKQTTYSVTEDNVYCLFYEGIIKGKLKREFRIISTYELAQLKCDSIYSLTKEPYFSNFELKDSSKIPLKYPLKKGTKVIPFIENIVELKELESNELIKRVYKVYKFNLIGTPYIYLQHHIEARKDNEIEKPYTDIDIKSKPMRYNLKSAKFNFAIEGKDFEIKIDGKIKWSF